MGRDTSVNIVRSLQGKWYYFDVVCLVNINKISIILKKVFNTKRDLIQMLGDFDRAWSLILEFIQNAALSKNGEVSLAALKSLQEIMYHNADAKTCIKTDCGNDKAKLKSEEIWNVNILSILYVEWKYN